MAAMTGSDAEILDSSITIAVTHPLYGAAVLVASFTVRCVTQEPRGLLYKPIPFRNFSHQPAAAFSFSQTRKDVGIQLKTETLVLRLGMSVQQTLVPSADRISGWKFRRTK